MQDHPSGNPDLVSQNKKKRRIGDKDLAPTSDEDGNKRPAPGKGKPDAEEGVGTVQNQKR
jgi:hypothetical protein